MTIENHAKVSKQIRAQGMVSTKLSRLQLKNSSITFCLFFHFFKPLEFKVLSWCFACVGVVSHLTKSALNNDELVVCVGLSNGWKYHTPTVLNKRAHCLKITQNVAFEFWHFPPIFVLLKLTCLVTLSASFRFSKTRQTWPFLAFLINFCFASLAMLNETVIRYFRVLGKADDVARLLGASYCSIGSYG